MPKVKIQKTLPVQAEKLFEAVQKILTTDKEVRALEPQLKICDHKSSPDCISAQISGSRIEGSFSITPSDKQSIINIELKIPLMLAPFKGLVQSKIEEKLDKIS